MYSFRFLNDIYTLDPDYAFDVLVRLWHTEPVGMASIILTSVGLCLTLMFKLLDFWWDIYKDRARQGKLKIELMAEQTKQGRLALCAVISNFGKEPIVVRDIGYAKRRLLGTEFVRMVPLETPLPHALNARDLVRILVTEEEADLSALADCFRVKDSLGKIWEPPDSEIRKARRQLKVLRATLARITDSPLQQRVRLEHLHAISPISTQN